MGPVQNRVGDEGEPITTMEALLDAFPDSRFNIDPKMDAAVPPLVEALRRTNSWDRVNIAAFSDRRAVGGHPHPGDRRRPHRGAHRAAG
ncbi:MAG: glycerophosphodiester phosphodiesterase, partial [Acidimicrobiia bacterium]